jgi:hypothetical protein
MKMSPLPKLIDNDMNILYHSIIAGEGLKNR